MRKMFVAVALLAAGILAGCGRGEYDERVNDAIRRAKSPPAAEPEGAEAGKAADPNAAPPAGAPPMGQ